MTHLHIPPDDFASWPRWRRNEWFATANKDICKRDKTITSQVYDGERTQRLKGITALENAPVQMEPTPLRRLPPPGEPFPIDALGGILGGAARAIADKIQVADGLAGASILAAASLATQSHADCIIPATGQSRPLSLFIVSVAASGDRKSSSDGEAMTPVRCREKTLRTIYDDALPDYRRAKRAFEVAVQKAEKTKGDWRDIDAAIRAVGDEPSPPLLPFLIADEPTFEGLTKLFERGQPSLGLFSDEGGGFVGGHAMSADNRLKTLAGLSLFWDGATVRRIRAGDGASALIGKRLALHLMAQPVAAAGLLADSTALDQGFLSRVLVSAPASLAGTRLQKAISAGTESSLRHYNRVILDLLERPFPLADGTANALEPRRLPFDQHSSGKWLRLCDAIEKKLGAGGEYETIRGFANKLAEHVARIAGVLTIVDDPEAGSINSDTLARAVALGDYYAGEALRLFEASAVSPEIAQAEKLLTWLNNTWREPTIGLRAIYQNGPNSIRDRDTAKKAVDLLATHGWLTKAKGERHIVAGNNVRDAWIIYRER
jgi:hypothetical protein